MRVRCFKFVILRIFHEIFSSFSVEAEGLRTSSGPYDFLRCLSIRTCTSTLVKFVYILMDDKKLKNGRVYPIRSFLLSSCPSHFCISVNEP
jgi:hypothetical protein